jgi:hypothetical protein
MTVAVPGAGHATLTLNAHDITAYVDQVELKAAVAELESTNLGSTAVEMEPGLPSWDGSFKITKWDATLNGYLQGIIGSKVTAVLVFTDSAAATVTYTWTTNAFLTGYNIAAAATGKIDSSPTIRFSGAPTVT